MQSFLVRLRGDGRIYPVSKTLFTEVASLICDYFENSKELSSYLKQLYELLGKGKLKEVKKDRLTN